MRKKQITELKPETMDNSMFIRMSTTLKGNIGKLAKLDRRDPSAWLRILAELAVEKALKDKTIV